jgi:zinc transport system substrate-binding protein
MLRHHLITVSLLAALSLSATLNGCGKPEPGQDRSDQPTTVVLAVNYPLEYFAQRIGADLVDATFPGPADGDPAFWEPGVDAIVLFQSADLVLRNGAGYARWMARASLPEGRMVDTSASFADAYIETTEETTHTHGPGGDHSHVGTAFTTWIDFTQSAEQADAIAAALADKRPDHADSIDANAAALRDELLQLDEDMMAAAALLADRPVVASHPVYQYWARRYGLNVKAVLWEPETVPDDNAMAELQTLLADHHATLMIWEGDPAEESVAKLQAIGVASVVFDPCGNRPDSGDWLTVMRTNIRNIASAASGN